MNLLRFYRLKSRSLVVKTTQTTVLHININVKQCVQSNSFSGSLSLIIDHGPESPGVARSAPKKRKILIGIVMHNRVCFMELSKLEKNQGLQNLQV